MNPKNNLFPTDDLIACREMAAKLEDYLRADVLFSPMDVHLPGGDRLRRLTLGDFLERARRLQATSLPLAEQAAFTEILSQFKHIRSEYSMPYAQHAVREVYSRLASWSVFLNSCSPRQRLSPQCYLDQVHSRLQIELLREEEPVGRAEKERFNIRLTMLDRQLRHYWTNGPFIWEASLAPAFPRKQFWWLYGRYMQANSPLFLLQRLIHQDF